MLESFDNLHLVLCLIIGGLICFVLFLMRRNYVLKNIMDANRLMYQSQVSLEEKFKNISNEILLRSHHDFIDIAKETFDKILSVEKAEYDKKQISFLNIIQPIQETLLLFDTKLSQLEKERVDAYSDLRRQVKDLMLYQQEIQRETNALSRALSTPFMSGQWGEMQLRRVVEIAGMIPYCDFVEQQQGENNRLRPDMIIKLPGERHIIVDAKAPIDAYMQAVNTGEEAFMEAHAKRIKAHIKALGQKSYWEQFSQSPEFVLMFLPGESFFSSAIKKDPTLVEYGVQERVIITTPITLIALLKAISFSWRNEAIARNAKQIGEVGRALFYSLEKLIVSSKGFYKRIQKDVEEYEKIDRFIDNDIVKAAKRLKILGGEISGGDNIGEDG